MNIEIVINGKKYTLAEAEELYRELDKIFGGKEYPLVPAPNYPQFPSTPSFPQPMPWFYTTSSTEIIRFND